MKTKLNLISAFCSYALGAFCFYYILADSLTNFSLGDDSSDSAVFPIFIFFLFITLISMYFYHVNIKSNFDPDYFIPEFLILDIILYILGIIPINPVFLTMVMFSNIGVIFYIILIIALYMYGICLAQDNNIPVKESTSEEQ